LREVVDRKRQGQPVAVAANDVPDYKVIDLMEALKRSLGGGAVIEKRRRAANRNTNQPPRWLAATSGWRDGNPIAIARALGPT
jgi:DNA end-binding protein Ku